MSTKTERERQIDTLLHDAEHAESGASIALWMKDYPAHRQFVAKAHRLREEAENLRRLPVTED